MNRIDRLTGILLLLQGGKRTASELAGRFEVSRRTVLRDVEALCEIGVPVISELGTLGGYSLPPDYSMPPLALTFHEVLLLRLALSSLSQMAATPFREQRESLISKVQTLMPERFKDDITQVERALSVTVPGRSNPTPFLDALLQSASRGQWVKVTYRSEQGVSEQTILPSHLRTAEGYWYCEAYSHEHGEDRRYRVDRFLDVKPTGKPREDKERAEPTAANGDPTLPEVRISLTARGVLLLEREPNLGPQIKRNAGEDGGVLYVNLRPQEYGWLSRVVLGLGVDARVLTPEPLIERVQEEIEAISRFYS